MVVVVVVVVDATSFRLIKTFHIPFAYPCSLVITPEDSQLRRLSLLCIVSYEVSTCHPPITHQIKPVPQNTPNTLCPQQPKYLPTKQKPFQTSSLPVGADIQYSTERARRIRRIRNIERIVKPGNPGEGRMKRMILEKKRSGVMGRNVVDMWSALKRGWS